MEFNPQAQHKRKGSALDQLQLEGCSPSSGKAARPSDAEKEQEQQGQEQQRQEEAPERLTQTCQLHLLQLRNSQEELIKKIDELSDSGLALLDQMRAAFLQRMAKVKQELVDMIDHAETALRAESASTLDCLDRASMAQALVGKLNIRTMDTEERPETLFSAQEEPAE